MQRRFLTMSFKKKHAAWSKWPKYYYYLKIPPESVSLHKPPTYCALKFFVVRRRTTFISINKLSKFQFNWNVIYGKIFFSFQVSHRLNASPSNKLDSFYFSFENFLFWRCTACNFTLCSSRFFLSYHDKAICRHFQLD